MTAIKPKVFLPYIIAIGCFAVIALTAQLGQLFSDERHSVNHSIEMAELCVDTMKQYYEQETEAEQLRYKNLVAEIAQNSVKPMELKAKRMEEGQLLMLVNPWNQVPEGYVPELENITDSQAVDVRCIDELRHMVLDCFLAGGVPNICSSYRTQEMQQALFDNKVMRVLAEGYSYADAPAVAAQSVAVPGTSEHQLGLAVDIIDETFPYLNYAQEYTYTQQWLIANSWKYGFILRYPNGTTDITGIIYEPWHYRFVGKDVAKEIHELGITFEEYIAARRGR